MYFPKAAHRIHASAHVNSPGQLLLAIGHGALAALLHPPSLASVKPGLSVTKLWQRPQHSQALGVFVLCQGSQYSRCCTIVWTQNAGEHHCYSDHLPGYHDILNSAGTCQSRAQ